MNEQHMPVIEGGKTEGESKVNISGFFKSLGELLDATLPPSEEVIFGGRRGQLSMLVSVTNLGKSTLMLNTAIMAAAGEEFLPLLPKPAKPIRTMIVDMEATHWELQKDITTMMDAVSDKESVRNNIFPVVDAEIDFEYLDLSNPQHYQKVLEKAKADRVDLVIVDNCSAAFELEDENSNAEVKKKILLPLKRLAREANCHVLFIHHIGKVSEDPTRKRDAAYSGRGASAFGALARAVFVLNQEKSMGEGHVVLSCAKVKGYRFPDTWLRLDKDKRWFNVVTASAPKDSVPDMQEVVAFIKAQGEATTTEVQEHFVERAASRTIDDRLAKASEQGLIAKDGQNSPWRVVTAPGNGGSQFAPDIGIADCESIQ